MKQIWPINDEKWPHFGKETSMSEGNRLKFYANGRFVDIIRDGAAMACSVASLAFSTSPFASSQAFPFSQATRWVSSSMCPTRRSRSYLYAPDLHADCRAL